MKIITHRSKQALENAAKQFLVDVYESDISFSFRVYENKNTKEFHQFFKTSEEEMIQNLCDRDNE